MRKEVIMPKIGLDMDEGTISKWLKNVGDKVTEGEAIVEIETDKTITPVEAAVTGTLVEIVAQEGDTVPITQTIAWVETNN
jgi:pyruvate/2-oxoglutarate dehydrogenase complex dihydrolipoamide acyltransferase (E2) component